MTSEHDHSDEEAGVVRLSISLEETLNKRLEKLLKQTQYANRSEFIRDLIRRELVEREWETPEGDVLGTITLIYDHHAYQLSKKLQEAQHDHHGVVLATTHVHLDHHHCAEVVMTRGKAKTLRKLFDALRKQRGVLHAALSLGSTGKSLR